MMTWWLLTCDCHLNHHPSHLSRVGGHLQTFLLFLDGCSSYSSKHNPPTLTDTKISSLLRFLQIVGVFRVKVPTVTSAKCLMSGCTFVYVVLLVMLGCKLLCKTQLYSRLKLRGNHPLMCWLSGLGQHYSGQSQVSLYNSGNRFTES